MVNAMILGGLVFLVAVFQSAMAQGQTSHVCRLFPRGTNQNDWVFKGNFARRVGDCTTIYHCNNGMPLSMGPCAPGLYFSVEIGVCDWPDRRQRMIYYGTNGCADEERKYERGAIIERRERVCATFRTRFANTPDQTRLYAGDPDNCDMYFNCQTHQGDAGYHSCTPGLFFNNDSGECNMFFADPNRCARN